jgi:fucose permease
MDVSMNAHGSAIEGALRRPIMSSLHAGWSFGGFTGAGLVAIATAAGVDPRVQNTVGAALLVAGLLVCLRALGPGSATAAGERFRLPSRAVVLMAVLCFLTMIAEGAMGDWGGVYLRGDLGATAGVAASAFAAFAAGMTIARVTGDRINERIGPTRLLRGGSALAAISLGTLLVLADPIAALAGLVLVGIGVANGVPLLFSAAGGGGVETSGPSIAAVSSMGSLGFLVGPPFIGLLADATSLPLALTTIVLATATVALLAGRVAGRAPHAQPEPAPA